MDKLYKMQIAANDENKSINSSPEPFNLEAEELNEDLESAIKSDAIGNTLYSKSWLLKFFLSLATSRETKLLEKSFGNQTSGMDSNKEETDTLDPECILSNFDSLVAMSAESSVAEYLIETDSGCLGMLIAEILPIQINDEHRFFKEIRSHFWRRQELCLVTLSNIVVHKEVLQKIATDISNKKSTNSTDDQNVLSELVRLSFSCVLFGENFGTEAEFTSVLVACFQFLRNLTYSISLLICENQENVSLATENSEENDQMIAQQVEKEYSCSPTHTSNSIPTETFNEEINPSRPTDEQNSGTYEEQKTQHNCNDTTYNILQTLVGIATEIVCIVSKPEVVQHFGMILASSCNEELLNKMSRLLTVLLELSSDLELESLVSSYGDLTFLNCLKEALKQTFVETRDIKTAFVFIDFIGEILSQFITNENQDERRNGLLDTDGQKDEKFPIELLDILSEVINEANDLPHCAIITKSCRVLWHPSISHKHSRSFQNVGSWLMNVREQISNLEELDLDDQVAFTSIIETLDEFVQNYDISVENKDENQKNETLVAKYVKSEVLLYRQNQGRK